MAINNKDLSSVNDLVAGITTTEGEFQTGLRDITFELDALQRTFFSGADPNTYNTAGLAVSLDAIRGLDASVQPSDINLLGGASTLAMNAVTADKFRVIGQLNASNANLNPLNGAVSTLTSNELNFLDGILTATTTAADTDDTNAQGATDAVLTQSDLRKLAGWAGNLTDLQKLSAVTATSTELNVLDGIVSTLTTEEINTLDGINTNESIQAQIDRKLDLADTDAGNGITLTESADGATNFPQVEVSINLNGDEGEGADGATDSGLDLSADGLKHYRPFTTTPTVSSADVRTFITDMNIDGFGHIDGDVTFGTFGASFPLSITDAFQLSIGTAGVTDGTGTIPLGAAAFDSEDFSINQNGVVSFNTGAGGVRGLFTSGTNTSYDDTDGSFSVATATSSTLGVASFDSSDFDIDSGAISISDSNIRGLFSAGSNLEYDSNTGSFSVPRASDSVFGVAGFNTTDFTVNNGSVSINDSSIRAALTSGTNTSYDSTDGSFDVATATTSVLGVASFNSDDFTVSSGAVSLNDSAIRGAIGTTGALTYDSNTGQIVHNTSSANDRSQTDFTTNGDIVFVSGIDIDNFGHVSSTPTVQTLTDGDNIVFTATDANSMELSVPIGSNSVRGVVQPSPNDFDVNANGVMTINSIGGSQVDNNTLGLGKLSQVSGVGLVGSDDAGTTDLEVLSIENIRDLLDINAGNGLTYNASNNTLNVDNLDFANNYVFASIAERNAGLLNGVAIVWNPGDIAIITGTPTSVWVYSNTASITGAVTNGDFSEITFAPTNLSSSLTATSVAINSSTGTDVTLAGATTSLAGVMTATDKSRLDGIQNNANNYAFSISAQGTSGTSNITNGETLSFSHSGAATVTRSGDTINVDAINTTYGAGAGLTLTGTTFAHNDTSSQASVNNSGTTFIQDVTLDGFGHVTGLNSATLSLFSGNYADLSGTPSTFTPSSHTHPASQITGLATVATSGSYNDLSNRPTIPANPAITSNGSTPSLASGITAAEVRGLIGAGTSSFNGAYGSLSGVPSTFTPSSHTHPISDVTGLQAALNLKANLASPAFTGNPTVPTQSAGNNSTRIASTAFVASAISTALADAGGGGGGSGFPNWVSSTSVTRRFSNNTGSTEIPIPAGATICQIQTSGQTNDRRNGSAFVTANGVDIVGVAARAASAGGGPAIQNGIVLSLETGSIGGNITPRIGTGPITTMTLRNTAGSERGNFTAIVTVWFDA